MDLKIKGIVASVLGLEMIDVADDSGLGVTKNWDSLRQMVLVNEIERVYECEFDLTEMEEATSIRGIAKILTGKRPSLV